MMIPTISRNEIGSGPNPKSRASGSTPSKREKSTGKITLSTAGGAVKRSSVGTGASEARDRTDWRLGPGYPSIGSGTGRSPKNGS